MKEKIRQVYEQKYKLLMGFTLLLVVLALVSIGYQYYSTGDFLHKGISLKGGSTITIDKSLSAAEISELKSSLAQTFPNVEVDVRTLSAAGQNIAILIDSELQEKNDITALTSHLQKQLQIKPLDMSVEVTGSALGQSFFRQLLIALLTSFVLMAIVVFIYLRSLGPSMAVILAAFSDIIITLAIFNLTGMKLTTAGVAAFLMLIGYSVDTDILLSSRLLKRKEGTEMERIYGSIKTGLTMTFTTLAAIGVALLLIKSEVVKQMMIILFIGLIVDMLMTWIQNVGLLRLYLEYKHKKHPSP
ncbi:protein translocase subunit SecF [Candidatus Woesearchaeota archaeon]|nr:protein translocase subunit SecF [Candidatus Woesearchaeota archaeon]